MGGTVLIFDERRSENKNRPPFSVVQQLAHIPEDAFPLLDDGHAQWQPRCVVSGFFFSSSGIGLVGRFSGSPVVNVSRGGGLIPALWVH